jgi:hypothetical protein
MAPIEPDYLLEQIVLSEPKSILPCFFFFSYVSNLVSNVMWPIDLKCWEGMFYGVGMVVSLDMIWWD